MHGLRALAAGSVLLLHVNDNMPVWGLPFLGRTEGGHFAVTVFFALSGFLITYLLLREKERISKIDIWAFYVRRTLRIWPLYFLYLALALLYDWQMGISYPSWLILFYVFFAANIPFGQNLFLPYAAHLWSLGVEEQFYLFWPWFIRWFRKPIYFLVGFFCAFMLLKVAVRVIGGGVSDAYMFLHVTRFECMAMGGIGAWVYWQGIPDWLKSVLFNWPVQIICWLCLAATVPDRFHVATFVDHTLIGMVSVVVILNLVANPKPLLRLENRVWHYLGGISFGLYIYHPVVAIGNGHLLHYLPFSDLGKIIFLYASVVIETILIAHLSMKYLEGPLLRLKDRFSGARVGK